MLAEGLVMIEGMIVVGFMFRRPYRCDCLWYHINEVLTTNL